MHTGFVALARPGYVIPVPVTTPPLTRLTGPQCAPLPPESPAPSTSVAVGLPPVPTTTTLAPITEPPSLPPVTLTEGERCELDPECFRLPATGAGTNIALLAVGVLALGAVALLAARRRP